MRRPVALLSTVAAVFVSGCGGDGGGPASLVAAALERSDRAESIEMTMRLDSDLGGQEMHMSGRARSNADATKMRARFAYREADEAAFSFEMIALGDVAYMRSAQLDRVLPKGKVWMRLSGEDLGGKSLTPAQVVDLLRDTPAVREVGRESIRGHRTVHLRGPMDLAKAGRRVGGRLTELVRNRPQLLRRMHATIDAWIGEKDERLHRVGMRLRIDGVPGRMRIGGDLLAEGVSLAGVTAPSARLVIDEDEVGKR